MDVFLLLIMRYGCTDGDTIIQTDAPLPPAAEATNWISDHLRTCERSNVSELHNCIQHLDSDVG